MANDEEEKLKKKKQKQSTFCFCQRETLIPSLNHDLAKTKQDSFSLRTNYEEKIKDETETVPGYQVEKSF